MFKDGIYFDLDEDDYHADPALGSTGIIKLIWSPPDFWWNSEMNPHRPDDKDDTPALIAGKALHRFVLEGPQSMAAKYVRRPDDLPDATPSEKAAVTKEAKKGLDYGMELLHGDIFDRITIAGTMISKDPELKTAFQGGYPEVSMFYTRPDKVRVKCRFDYLKPGGFADLKSIGNTLQEDFRMACLKAIRYRNYTVQASHYLAMRAMLPQLVTKGLVFANGAGEVATAEQETFIKKVAETKKFGMAWVFYQKDKAPITHSRSLSWENPIVKTELEKVERGIDNYKKYLKQYGKDIWVLSAPMTELTEDELPSQREFVE